MQAKNSKNAQEEECVMKLNEMKNSNTERNGLEAPLTVQEVENQEVSTVKQSVELDEIVPLKPEKQVNKAPKIEVFELEAPSNKPVGDKVDYEYIKLMGSLGASAQEAVRLEKEHRLEQRGVFKTQLFPNESELTQIQKFELQRQIVILDACRVTKIVKKDGRRIHYLHCRVVSRNKLLMHTTGTTALFKTDALYPLVDAQVSNYQQDITGTDFKEVNYEFERLEKPVIIGGQILRKIDINPYYEDEDHIEKLVTIVRFGVDELEWKDTVLTEEGETLNDAIKRYRAFIEAAGIEE
jgi:hypothetical protein